MPKIKFPPADAADLDAAWDEFFANNTPSVRAVALHMLKLLDEGSHKQLVAALRAALINGQAQPWMYEALAGSMAIEKYPKEEIERVLLSMTDFGQADFHSMVYSAAYLVRFDRVDSALKMYRQASRMDPERPEPYILSLGHASQLKSADDVAWAACGVLKYDWTQERAANTKMALEALATLERQIAKAGRPQEVEKLQAAVAEARSFDVLIELVWTGDGDVDLEIEEPSGTVCSLTQPQTSSGGYHLGDGYGPEPKDCRETYVCPSGFAGEYRIRIKHSSGKVVGQRATLTITTHKGAADEQVEQRTIVFKDAQGTASVKLETGRRQQPRIVQETRPVRNAVALRPAAKALRDPNVVPAGGQANSVGGFLGVVGFQPNIQVLREGATLGASAIISPDRRYVRLAVSPMFSNITDVFTFSFFGGGATNQGNGGAGQPNQ